MAAVNNLVSMYIAATCLLRVNNALVRASTRAAAQRPGPILR
jgi:hypothetical protein